jgi:hypothetical protein
VLLVGTVPDVIPGSAIRVELLPGPRAFEIVIAAVLIPLGSSPPTGYRYSSRNRRSSWELSRSVDTTSSTSSSAGFRVSWLPRSGLGTRNLQRRANRTCSVSRNPRRSCLSLWTSSRSRQPTNPGSTLLGKCQAEAPRMAASASVRSGSVGALLTAVRFWLCRAKSLNTVPLGLQIGVAAALALLVSRVRKLSRRGTVSNSTHSGWTNPSALQLDLVFPTRLDDG